MKTSEIDILIVPGWSSSGTEHWQTRWERSLRTARRVDQDDWLHPNKDAWSRKLLSAIDDGSESKPIVIIAHSLGVALVAHAASKMHTGRIAGAFLVAPADVDNADKWPTTNGYDFDYQGSGFAPLPDKPLPFQSVLIGSANDPYCNAERAEVLANTWGATFISAGEAGHINSASGHGPWPEGLMRFGWFLKQIGPANRNGAA
ncbi:MAG: alpha/beta hydrolase [Hyphomicrobiaceae bacterium]|nr:alpha/beta hydrolase [Hyphomicrobiaceae bacterium]MCC0009842.1 alpha/beta hydrolase [Hyphomicrobiaceae bacterium]